LMFNFQKLDLIAVLTPILIVGRVMSCRPIFSWVK